MPPTINERIIAKLNEVIRAIGGLEAEVKANSRAIAKIKKAPSKKRGWAAFGEWVQDNKFFCLIIFLIVYFIIDAILYATIGIHIGARWLIHSLFPDGIT